MLGFQTTGERESEREHFSAREAEGTSSSKNEAIPKNATSSIIHHLLLLITNSKTAEKKIDNPKKRCFFPFSENSFYLLVCLVEGARGGRAYHIIYILYMKGDMCNNTIRIRTNN